MLRMSGCHVEGMHLHGFVHTICRGLRCDEFYVLLPKTGRELLSSSSGFGRKIAVSIPGADVRDAGTGGECEISYFELSEGSRTESPYGSAVRGDASNVVSITTNIEGSPGFLLAFGRRTAFTSVDKARHRLAANLFAPFVAAGLEKRVANQVLHDSARHLLPFLTGAGVAIVSELGSLMYADSAFNQALGEHVEDGDLQCFLRERIDFGDRENPVPPDLFCVRSIVHDVATGSTAGKRSDASTARTFVPADSYTFVAISKEWRRRKHQDLKTKYGITKTEAQCIVQFIMTPDIRSTANAMRRSQSTVRNHLKSAMSKLEVHSQAQMLKIVMQHLAEV